MVKDYKSFMKVFDELKQGAREMFERDKRHIHIMFIFEKGRLVPIPFDDIMEQLPAGIPTGNMKEIVFKLVSELIYEAKSPGYFNIAEAWALDASNEGITDPKEANRKFKKALDRHDTDTMEKVPGRIEILFVGGRWKNKGVMARWQIGRRDNEVYLFNFSQDEYDHDEVEADSSRASVLDQAVMAVASEAK